MMDSPEASSTAETVGPDYKAHDGGISRVNMSEIDAPGGDVLKTARHPQLGHAPSRLTDDSVVTYQGVQMRLGEAVRLGLVSRSAAGDYSDATDVSTKPPQGSDEKQPDENKQPEAKDSDKDQDGPQAFDPDSEKMFAYVVEQIPEPLRMGVVEKMIESGVDGLDLTAAAHSNMTPEAYRASLSGIANRYQAQADQFVQQQGFNDTQAFYDWARETRPAETKDAMRQFVLGRNPKVFSDLVQAYRQSVMPSNESLRANGYDIRPQRDGTTLVNIDGQWMSVASAAKLGLV
jgi:hypothetical protein